ncbi:hypothetical protein EDD22DRAFT_80017 [Suillus occidentalis]|nr:hypothetical protein EDD22DRAFT_80017 [Suillus occidentalis]
MRYDNPPPYRRTSPSETDRLMHGEPSHLHQSFKSYIQTALIAIMTASIAIIIYASAFNTCNEPFDPEAAERQEREDIRLRLNMFWTDLTSHPCTTYATREYTARLANVPSYYNRRVEACMATPVNIHGVEYTPKWCEDRGPNNVIGHWEVDQHEPDCASYWIWYKDFGCISPGSGQRRIEHYLENIPSGGDWKEFCATTPASFRGMHFTGAQFCFNKNQATWGHWVLDDESCK